MNNFLEKKNSPIHGYGIFAKDNIKRGKVLVDWISTSNITDRGRHQYGSLTSIRLVGELFLDGNLDDTDFFNHSDTPNSVCILGLVISLRDIQIGEEITLDYSLLNAPDEWDVVQGSSIEDSVRRMAACLILCLNRDAI